jgi:HK97 family phage prohead protease
MAYKILAKDGRPIKNDGNPVMAMDVVISKIEQLDDSMKSFVAVASTEDEDRDKDIIRQDGWKLNNFKKNPMVPWMHDYWGVPVARSLRTWVDKSSKRLLFKPQFDENDDMSMKVYNKYKNGFLTSFSVGFRGLESVSRDENDPWWGGREFTKQELLEISAVTIPANPNASVNLNGEGVVQNMLQLGYPQVFAKTEFGLFYPVREMGEYTDPKTEKLEEGVSKVLATALDDKDEEKAEVTVGYIFTPEWESGEAAEYIRGNVPMKYKHYYYDFKSTDDSWEIELMEEEKEVPVFPEPVEINVTETAEKDKETEVDKIDDEIETEELAVEVDDTQKTETQEKFDEFFKQFEELIDILAEKVTTRLDEMAEKISEAINEVKLFVNEKNVDNDLEITDNEDEQKQDDTDSKDNDFIEFDEKSFTPDDDKQTDDDTIELDDEIVEDGKVAKNVFGDLLKETLKRATKDVLKIDL